MTNKALLIFTCLVFASPALAHTEQGRDQDKVEAEQLKQREVELRVKNNPKLVRAEAVYMRSLFNNLLWQGFTQEQALHLVAARLRED